MSTKISSMVESYIAYKHGLGFQITGESVYLRDFARYTESVGYDGSLTRSVVSEWCERGNPSQVTKGRRFEPLKAFADYANAYDSDSELLPHLPYGNPHRRLRPHIYSLEETCLLMDKCSELYSPDGIRALTVKTAIGLMWASGLRTSELVGLTIEDVDLTEHLLLVRSSKFNKSRIVPIQTDVSKQLLLYRKRVTLLSSHAGLENAFFVTTGGVPLKRDAFEYAFRKIRDVIDVSDSDYDHARLYDFRHSFATRTIKKWLENGEDVNAKLYLLSTYLGHVHPEDTYWYLSSTPELMNLSSGRYELAFGGENHA